MTYRLVIIERDIVDLRNQIQTYVPMREHELQLRTIQDTADSIKKQVADLTIQMATQAEAQAKQQKSQDQLLIRLQWGIISTVGGLLLSVVAGVAIFFFTHLP